MSKEEQAVEDWQSDPCGMMVMYQSQQYLMGQSIADLIDNCYDGGAKNIKVVFGMSGGEVNVRVYDDGKGIPEEKMASAMKLGVQRERSLTDLGVFGIGMKLSSLAQADEVTVMSRNKGNLAIRRISADHIKSTNRNELLKRGTDSDAFLTARKELLQSDKWETMVLLEGVHGIKNIRKLGEDLGTSLTREVERIRVHLGITYHRVMTEGKLKDVSLTLQGREITPIDPRMPWEDSPKWGLVSMSDYVGVEIEGVHVTVPVDFCILPHRKRWKKKMRCEMVHRGYKKANDMQGLYLYRNRRLIQYGGWQGLFGEALEEHHKLGAIHIDIPAKHGNWFGLNPTKTNMELPMEFRELLREKCEELRSWGQIQKGKQKSFGQAFDYRYRNEGKKSPSTRPKPRSTPPRTGGISDPPPTRRPAPQRRTKKYGPKPQAGVVKDIKAGRVVTLDVYKVGYKKLLEYLKKWQ